MDPRPSSNNYGTISNPIPAPNYRDSLNEAGEHEPFLSRKAQAHAWWKRRIGVDVRRDWADLLLLACYIITGLLDSASISTWGAFVSMQTGESLNFLSYKRTSCAKPWIPQEILSISDWDRPQALTGG